VAVRPADRLLFIIALSILGIAILVRLWPGKLPESPKAPEPLRLVIGVMEEGPRTEALKLLSAGYARESQNIDLIVTGEGEADILFTEGHFLAGEIAAGLYLPLDKFQRSAPSSPVEKWALPLVSSMDVLIYNIPLLRAAGFDRPPRTRSEFLTYARGIHAGNAGPVYPFALGLSPRDAYGIRRDIFSWIRSGGLPLVKDGKPLFGGQRYTEALEFFSLLNGEELLAPGSFTAAGQDRVEEFIRGGIAMMVVSSGELRGIREKMEDGAVGITLVPQADDYTGKPVLGLSTWYAGIRAGSPHPGEAWALLSHLKERSAFLAEALVLVPGTGVYEPYISLDPLLDKAWDMYEAADMAEEFLEIPGTGELEAALRRELESMFRRDSPKSPEETAIAIRQSWEQWKGPENLW
jgi:ABC-type glycerol-3-phosphate transport system substrate-binding protein